MQELMKQSLFNKFVFLGEFLRREKTPLKQAIDGTSPLLLKARQKCSYLSREQIDELQHHLQVTLEMILSDLEQNDHSPRAIKWCCRDMDKLSSFFVATATLQSLKWFPELLEEVNIAGEKLSKEGKVPFVESLQLGREEGLPAWWVVYQ